MHVTLIALGSRGDVHPYAVLGKGLKAAGHGVRFATFESFRPLIEAHGLDFHPIKGDAQALVGGAGADMAKLIFSFSSLARGYAADLTPLASLPTDCIVIQLPGALYGYDLAEKLGVKLVMAGVIPLAATRTRPVMGFPRLPLPGYNRLSYWLAEQLLWGMFRSVINDWRRKSLGLRPSPHFGYFGNLEKMRVPVLNGFSSQIVPRQADWGEHIHLTGYWFPHDAAWQPSPELISFINDGPPPVFIGFGSMPVKNLAGTTRLILEALQQSGQRAVLHAGWAGLDSGSLPPDVFPIQFAPYGWLFTKMAAVVHHGGSGTTHFGVQAGVPSLAIPFIYDQFYWGSRLATLGVEPAPIPYSDLSAERLAKAITRMTTDAAMRSNAAELGETMRQERGLDNAIEVIEALR